MPSPSYISNSAVPAKHPDRNAQFEYINKKVVAAQARQQPVISVDTKKKELVGNFKNGGTDYRPKGDTFHPEWNYTIKPRNP